MAVRNGIIRSIILLTCVSFLQSQVGFALPEINEIVSGDVSIETPDANTMNITATANSIINYNSLNILENETVSILLPNSTDAILNRDIGGLQSNILGSLFCNGIFMLVNTAGINIGATASINAAGVILSTRDISNTDFLNGKYLFEKFDGQFDGYLVNSGAITVQTGGFVAFLSGALANNGTIIASLGRVAMAGGDAIEIDISGTGKIFVVIKEEAASKILDFAGDPITDQLKNTGSIEAVGGTVMLKAESVYDIFDCAINISGEIKATGIVECDGFIYAGSKGNVVTNAKLEATKIEIGDSAESVPENVYVTGGSLNAEKGVEIYAENNLELYSNITVTEGDIKLEYDFDNDGAGVFDHVLGLLYVRRNGNIYVNGNGVSFVGLPLYFLPNLGQIDDEDVLYYVVAGNDIFYFSSNQVAFFILEQISGEGGIQSSWMPIYLEFIGGNPGTAISPGLDGGAVFNYYHGNDPSKYNTGISSFLDVNYTELYSGIDLNYGSKDGRLKSVFKVKPGADYHDIQAKYENVQSMELDGNGNLVINTNSGKFVEMEPFAYQTIGGKVAEVECDFVILSENTYGFELGAYDISQRVIIDPTLSNSATGEIADLNYSTFLGGSGSENSTLEGGGIAVSTECAYVTGFTDSIDFPITPGAEQPNKSGGYDAFLTKVSKDGKMLLYSTYLGGEGNDYGSGIALDGNGNAYITGHTDSADFPVNTPYQATNEGGTDAFVTKISDASGVLSYSTYLGGSDYDRGHDIAVDSGGNAYVTGYTRSSDFDTKAGAFDDTFNGANDAFVTKFSADGTNLEYSTYLGGSTYDHGSGIVVDASGCAYVTGGTTSSDFPTTSGAYDETHNGGNDTFVAKLSEDGTSLEYSTYLGGSQSDMPGLRAIAIDSTGQAYVTGYTCSSDFPTTRGAYQPAYMGGGSGEDGYVTKLSADGASLNYSTFIGSNGRDLGEGIAVDYQDCAYVTGYTESELFPTTADAYDGTYNGGGDAFLLKLDNLGRAVEYATFFGGSDFDRAFGIDIASANGMVDIYLTGVTQSSDFPTTAGAFDTTFNGGTDAFVAKFEVSIPTTPEVTYSTYLGGSGDEGISDGLWFNGSGAIAVDNSGYAYVTGCTRSVDFPSTSGGYQPGSNGVSDAFVTKISQDGSSLIFSTYLGGSNEDVGFDIAIDPEGSSYLTGYTESADFPVTETAYQVFLRGRYDVFVMKFSSSGADLEYSTYLGGGDEDFGHSIAVDKNKCAYVTGYTRSSDFPVKNAFSAYGLGVEDAFVTKLNSSGTDLEYSTYLSGSSGDVGMGIAVSEDGHAYVAGVTSSSDFPCTSGAYQTTFNGEEDAFITKLSIIGDELEYSTYLGGARNDRIGGIVVDESGSVYVTGCTTSEEFPTTAGAYQTVFIGGDNEAIAGEVWEDGFISKLTSDGDELEYSTYFGGSKRDRGFDIALDAVGRVFVTGDTESPDFPVTANAWDSSCDEYSRDYRHGDAFFVKINSDGSSLEYATYLGGDDSSDDRGYGVALDFSGSAYIMGYTRSDEFPTTPGAFDRIYNGGADVFVTKFDFTPAPSTLEYSTYLGGSYNENEGYYGNDVGGIAVDSAGSAYVTGSTSSRNFPTTEGAYDRTYEGHHDAFVTKFSADGKSLIYSTYLGGWGNAFGTDIDVDSMGNAYVSGFTALGWKAAGYEDFPITANVFQKDFGGGEFDGFITKLNSIGGGLEYSTYLGGSENDMAISLAIENDYVYVTGRTYSDDLPTTTGVYQENSLGGQKAFVAKIYTGEDEKGKNAEYCTYLGGNTAGSSGSSGDVGRGIDVEGGFAYVTGVTYSSDFPTTTSAYQETLEDAWSAFVTKLNSDGSGLEYSTYLGGSAGGSWANAIVVDSAGKAYVTGRTGAKDFPITPGVYHDENWRVGNTGGLEVFVTKVNSDGSDLGYSTVIGGSQIDHQVVNVGTGIAIDPEGNAYVTGYTRNKGARFPITFDAYQVSYGGSGAGTSPWAGGDAFLLKLNPEATNLDYSTFIGGGDFELTDDIALSDLKGEEGNYYYEVFITGRTASQDFPTTSDAFDRTLGGQYDAFVSKFRFLGIPSKVKSVFVPEQIPDESTINDIVEKTDVIQQLRAEYRSLALAGRGVEKQSLRLELDTQIAGIIADVQMHYSLLSADDLNMLKTEN